MRDCGHTQIVEGCHLCQLYATNPAYRQFWEADPRQVRNLPCINLGSVLDRLNCDCPARWIRLCAVHSFCTIDLCKTCPDYQPLE
jgi:hypothetical protein